MNLYACIHICVALCFYYTCPTSRIKRPLTAEPCRSPIWAWLVRPMVGGVRCVLCFLSSMGVLRSAIYRERLTTRDCGFQGYIVAQQLRVTAVLCMQSNAAINLCRTAVAVLPPCSRHSLSPCTEYNSTARIIMRVACRCLDNFAHQYIAPHNLPQLWILLYLLIVVGFSDTDTFLVCTCRNVPSPPRSCY